MFVFEHVLTTVQKTTTNNNKPNEIKNTTGKTIFCTNVIIVTVHGFKSLVQNETNSNKQPYDR